MAEPPSHPWVPPDEPMPGNLVDPTPRFIGDLFSVGPLALGTWRFTDPDVDGGRRLLETALDLDMNLIDTADVYGLDWGGSGFGSVEENLGRVLAASPGLRDRFVLATKGGIRPGVPYDSSPGWLGQACEDSLRRLQVDVIDVYQIHRSDLFAHPEDIAEVLLGLREAGKIRAVGVSNHTPAQVETLAAFLGDALLTTQPELSLAHLDPVRDGSLDQAIRLALAPLAWSPLAGGSIATGEGLRPELLTTLDRLAAREQVDRSAIALAFLLALPSDPIAVVGTQQPARLIDAHRALDVHLDRRDCCELVVAAEGVPLP
jgi:predicted oxidoreductase